MAKHGDETDLIIVYDADMDEEDLLQRRDEALAAMETAGLRLLRLRSRDEHHVLVLITASRKRLEREAGLRKLPLKLRKTFVRHFMPDGWSMPIFSVFTQARSTNFELSEGRLFSSLERSRLIFTIIEGSAFRGGAEQDIDDLIADGVFEQCFSLHASEQREALYSKWVHWWPTSCAAEWKWRREERRRWPDLGLLQQPLDQALFRVRALPKARSVSSSRLLSDAHF